MLESKREVEDWVYQNFDIPSATKIEILDNLEIVVHGDLQNYTGLDISVLPVVFKQVLGWCFLGSMGLESLHGSPRECKSFQCSGNYLSRLEGGPLKIITGDYICSFNDLVSLKGLPLVIPGNLICHQNPLKTLEGFPSKVGGKVILTYKTDLPLLRTLAASTVEFDDYRDSLEEEDTVAEILNRYAGKGKRAMFECQKALEDAGFKENARW
jgi:hypothetical protein